MRAHIRTRACAYTHGACVLILERSLLVLEPRFSCSVNSKSLFMPLAKPSPGGAGGKEPAWQSRRCKRLEFDPWVGKIPWRRARRPTPVSLPGESHGQRSLAGYRSWVTESWTQLSAHTQSLRTESFNERSAPSAVLPGAGNHPKRLEGLLFSLNPQGPLTCLGLLCGSLFSKPILLFLQLHFSHSVFSEIRVTAEGEACGCRWWQWPLLSCGHDTGSPPTTHTTNMARRQDPPWETPLSISAESQVPATSLRVLWVLEAVGWARRARSQTFHHSHAC